MKQNINNDRVKKKKKKLFAWKFDTFVYDLGIHGVYFKLLE